LDELLPRFWGFCSISTDGAEKFRNNMTLKRVSMAMSLWKKTVVSRLHALPVITLKLLPQKL